MKPKMRFIIVLALIALLLCTSVGAVLFGNLTKKAAAADTVPTLRNLTQAKGVYVSAAVNTYALSGDPKYAQLLDSQFGMVEGENAMKFDATEPHQQGVFDFTQSDVLVNFAQQHNMAVRGHALAWWNQLPGWLTNGTWSKDQAKDILHNHISTLVGRYKGKIYAWDVLNEAIAGCDCFPHDSDGVVTDQFWYKTIGPEYIADAFQWAHEADPSAKLFYNDYGAETLGAKSDQVYNFVKGLKARGVPIDGVGLQTHLRLDTPPSFPDMQTNIQRLAALGLEVHITELDVQTTPYKGTESEKMQKEADLYQGVMQTCLAVSACKAINIWGLDDGHSWLAGGVTGTTNQEPLLFNEGYEPKQAFYALAHTLDNNVGIPSFTYPAPATVKLRDLAAAHSIAFGTALNSYTLSDSEYSDLVSTQFNRVTAENEMKFDATEPMQGTFTFADGDKIVKFATDHNMTVRGHVMANGSQLPQWLTGGTWTRDQLMSILKNHIQMLMQHWNTVNVWDVVNEPFYDSCCEKTSDVNGLRDSNFWYKGIGPEYIDLAFQWANQANPSAKLCLNEGGNEDLNGKAALVYNYVKGMLARGIPISCVGIETHLLDWGSDPPSMQGFQANLQQLSDLGVEVQITELDAEISSLTGPSSQKLQEQADVYSNIVRACLAVKGCGSVSVWGADDGHSWLPGFDGHGDDQGLLFFRNYLPKPAFQAIVDAFNGTGAPNGPLSSPWSNVDIGPVGVLGSASSANTTFTLKGAGADIADKIDGFQYVYQQLTGDGSITARVIGQTNTDNAAKAGVMIRNVNDYGSQFVDTVVLPTGSVIQQWRSPKDTAVQNTEGSTSSLPVWLRVTRTGDTFTSSSSSDGHDWTDIATQNVPMASTVSIGLIVTAHSKDTLSTATFDNVSTTGQVSGVMLPPPPPVGGGGTPTPTPTPTPPPTGKTTIVDDSVQGNGMNQFNYVGSGWNHCTNCGSELYNQSNSWDKTTDDYVTVTFSGTQIKFYGVTTTLHGIGAVSIDGASETNIDFYATGRRGNVLLWTSPVLSAGTHTFKLRVTGTKHPDSSDYNVVPDFVEISE